MRSAVSRLKQKNNFFQNYKKFDVTKFLSDLKNTNSLLRLLTQMKTIYFTRIRFSR